MSGIFYIDNLIARAQRHWSKGEPLPTDLFAEMLAEGIDVEALEKKYRVIL